MGRSLIGMSEVATSIGAILSGALITSHAERRNESRPGCGGRQPADCQNAGSVAWSVPGTPRSSPSTLESTPRPTEMNDLEISPYVPDQRS